MGWEVDFNNGQYTFPLTTRWQIRDRQQIKDDGGTDYIEEILLLDGEIIGEGSTPEDMAADTEDKFEEMREALLVPVPVRIELFLDGNSRWVFDPAEQIGTPKVREIVDVGDGASHATHVKFQVSVYMKVFAEGQFQSKPVTDLFREVEEISYDQKLQQKRWGAKCRAKTLGVARSLVMSFKPKGVSPLTEKYTERIDVNEFEAEWVFDNSKKKEVTQFFEVIDWTKPGKPGIEDPLVGKNAEPFIHEGRNRSGKLSITMTFRGQDPSKMGRPAPHLSPSKQNFRDPTKEAGEQPPLLVDSVKGEYVAIYREYWLVTRLEPNMPKLNHSDHAKPFPDTPVPNGTIGGSQSAKIAIYGGG